MISNGMIPCIWKILSNGTVDDYILLPVTVSLSAVTASAIPSSLLH